MSGRFQTGAGINRVCLCKATLRLRAVLEVQPTASGDLPVMAR